MALLRWDCGGRRKAGWLILSSCTSPLTFPMVGTSPQILSSEGFGRQLFRAIQKEDRKGEGEAPRVSPVLLALFPGLLSDGDGLPPFITLLLLLLTFISRATVQSPQGPPPPTPGWPDDHMAWRVRLAESLGDSYLSHSCSVRVSQPFAAPASRSTISH